MKKFQDKAIKCALALCAATGMVACSSSDEAAEAPVNPTYDGVSVKTQFAINVAGANKNTTRMSDENTQNAGNYLGIANVCLFTLVDAPAANTVLTSDIALAEPGDVNIDNSSHIYSDVNIPVGTKNFLFYSTRKGLGTDLSGYQTTGAIVSDVFDKPNQAITDLNGIEFSGKQIIAVSSDIATIKTAFTAYLNNIVTAFGEPTGALKNAKTEFIKNFLNAQRAGSAFAVLKQVDQLYKVANGVPAGDVDGSIANAVKTAITEGGTSGIKTAVVAGTTDLEYPANLPTTYSNFPIAQGLPDGSIILAYDNGAFKYTTGESAQIGGEKKINMNNITFPLPVMYFDNTPAKANDAEIKNWPTTTETWDAEFTNAAWGNEVIASTRSIALQNNINYGVAGLRTTVKCAASTLKDNAYEYTNHQTADQTITIPAGGFTVSGLLIGGQPAKVGWQMVDETASTSAKREYVVYDSKTNGAKASTSASAPIYTLVFDNYKDGVLQENVNVAIELVNNSDQTFYAQDGLVEKGQRFYLIGQLELTDEKKEALTWPAYGTGGLNTSYEGRYPVKATADGKRIFIQDYTTEANFTISSLKNAYVTIPDLRATLLQLGLSVDLQWQSGLKFDVEIE